MCKDALMMRTMSKSNQAKREAAIQSIREKLKAKEAAAFLGNRKRIRCPFCGNNYITGYGHFDSDFCYQQAALKFHTKRKNKRLNMNTGNLLADSGVQFVIDLGGLHYDSSKFRNVQQKEVYYVRPSVHKILNATRYGFFQDTENRRSIEIRRDERLSIIKDHETDPKSRLITYKEYMEDLDFPSFQDIQRNYEVPPKFWTIMTLINRAKDPYKAYTRALGLWNRLVEHTTGRLAAW
jgi:hypothetical protein